MGMTARLHRLADRVGLGPRPRIVTLTTFVPAGCRFEVTCRIEAYRVERYGDEEDLLRRVLAELSPADTLFDVGACVGMVGLHAAAQGSRVVAFEPDPAYRHRLQVNRDLNGLGNVQIVPWAVSDGPGEARLYTDGVNGLSPSLRATTRRGSVWVRTDSVDRALARGEIPAPTVVKLDVEGAEMLALRGMETLLASAAAPRTLFIGLHPGFLPSFGSSVDEVGSFLTRLGYHEDDRKEAHRQFHAVYRRTAS
jgi:FkbM family methyltransferase